MSILNESQLDRDKELAKLLGMTLKEVQALPIATPDSIRISDGEKPENLEDLYHDYEHLNFPAYLRTLMKTSATRRHPELFKFLKSVKHRNCLDFGSGVGTHAIALLENYNWVGILDVPGKLFDFAKKRIEERDYPNPFNNKVGIWNNTSDLPDDFFDVVICTDVLEHVEDPIKELCRIRRTMKIGGVLHLQVSTMVKPSSGHFKESIDKWKMTGKSYLDKYFEKVGATLYRRKK